MEVAIIDWKNLDSRFVRDDVYEHINAPQWFDFLAPDVSIDDDSWFCRPDCNHPKTVEDFYRQTPPNSKKLSGLSKRLPFAELTMKRDSTLKKRGLASYAPVFPNDSKSDTNTLDSENQNPLDFSTPLNHKSKVYKETVKSSAEKKEQTNEKTLLRKEQPRGLKSTLSARNLFSGGGDILSKVAEFCTELKKLTLRKKEKEEEHAKEAVVCVGGDSLSDESRNFDVKEKETKPLLLAKANSENCKALPEVNNNMLEKPQRKIRRYEDENTPVKVDVKIIKRRSEEENVLPIRTCPPTPQCISANRVPSKAGSPLKEIILLTTPPQEERAGYRKPSWKKEQGGCQSNHGRQASSTVTDKEAAKGLDVFWFLKPCRIST